MAKLSLSTTARDKQQTSQAPSDFETAIDASGFGIFNMLLLLVALFAAVGSVFETSTISYILPSAECDLKLSLLDKGVLNAITYAGMITSAIAWGYVADTKGRKKILLFGYLGDGVCVVGASLSQNVMQLMIFKFLGGLVMCGPFAVLMTYLTELHSKQYRARIMMLVGMMFSVASLSLPGIAMAILPYQWNFQILGLAFHSWQLFLAVSAVPSLLSGALLALFPESPKFLMSQGRNVEALEVLQKIYAINKRQPRETYPIKELVNELAEKRTHLDVESDVATITVATISSIDGAMDAKSTHTTSRRNSVDHTKVSFREGLLQLQPLFVKPYLGLSLIVYVMNFCILLGQNTVRLWLPQLFASIAEFELKASSDGNGAETTMCAILAYTVNKTEHAVENTLASSCEVVLTPASYYNNLTVAAFGFVGYILVGSLIDCVGGKRILTLALLISGTCAIALYWSASSLAILLISATFGTMGSIASTSVISASVNLFPTALRTMIVSLAMMFGRVGSLLGNILFPTFISFGCIPPFIMISFVMFLASILSAFLPNTNKIALK